MAYPSVFDPATTQTVFERLEKLTPKTTPQWGKMDAAQMLAHLNVAYDTTYTNPPNYGWFKKKMMKLFVKNVVVGDKPYTKNSRTAPQFLISDSRDFEKEKAKFVENVKLTEQKGVAYFEGRENPGFGELTSKEWSNIFSKHLEHHFEQFGI